jgi:hypothetical protein
MFGPLQIGPDLAANHHPIARQDHRLIASSLQAIPPWFEVFAVCRANSAPLVSGRILAIPLRLR